MQFSVLFLAERVLNAIPEGVLIAALAWLLLKLVGRQNAGTRFAVWFGALLAIAALPFVPLTHLGGTVARATHAELVLPSEWALGILSVWGLLAAFGIARILFGIVRLGKLRRNSLPVRPEELAPEVRETLEQCANSRAVELRLSADIQVPAAIGFLTPAILIPEWTLRDLSSAEMRAVVLHEFAHLRRRDDWTNLAQKLLRALFFFHPAVLWVEKRLSLEREMACDDAVLEATGNAHAYARCLVSLAEKNFVRRSLALAQAVIGRAKETTARVAQILDLDRPTATRVFKPVVGALAGVVLGSFALLPAVPKLISFSAPAEIAQADMTPRIDRAMVVPAKFVLPESNNAQRLSMNASGRASKVLRGSKTSNLKSVAPTTKHIPQRPMVIQAGMKSRREAPMRQMLVYTETTNYYQHAGGVVGFTEWQIMLVKVPVAKSQNGEKPNRT